ncbi:MAG: diacylglycerol kinase family lipid kinase [Luteolibacter sp.]|jgi:YegS/Rv2252/BmrU family lipid kinase|nr:diacylglycerol kinase family lipid kinase [Luteolibacter sp.]
MAQPRRYPIIFNPKARGQKGGRVLRFLMKHANRFALYATDHAGEARDLAAGFAARGEPVVIAAGGDGTLNEVVSGLAGSATVLGVLPAGTMNVFAREMGIPFDSLERAFVVIEAGHMLDIDLFEANGAPFVQMAGVGFDARVIEETTWEAKKMLGPLAYLLAAVKVLGEKPPTMEVVCADGRREVGFAVLAGNGSLYGGQFKFFRNADNRDSKLDVLVYKEAGYRLVLDSLRGLALGGIDLLESTSAFQTEAFTVHADREVPVEVDGEWLGRFKEVRFKETASRLRVIVPDGPLAGGFADSLRSLLQWPRRQPEFQSARTL